MARSTFGGFGGDQVSLDPAGNSGYYKAAQNYTTGTFWSASTGGTQYTDLVDAVTSVALGGVSTDAHGHVVPFKGPDGITEGWLDFGGGRFKVTAVDANVLDSRYATIPASPAANNLLARNGTNTGFAWTTSQASVARGLGWKIVTDPAYGADPTASVDSTTAINNATAALTGGGIVWFPAGTYLHTGVTLPNFVELRGSGPGNTVLRNTSTTADSITSTSTNLVAVRDMQLESLVTKTAGSHLNFTSVAGYVIDNVRFIDGYNLGTFTSSNSGWLSRIKVAHGTGNINRGFWWQSCVDTHLAHILINGGTTVLPAGNAWLQIDSGCDTWAGVDFGAAASSGSGMGLYFSHSLSPGSFAPRWVKASNFWFEGSSGTAGSGANAIQIDNILSGYFSNGYTATSNNGLVITGGRDIKFNQCLFMNHWLRGAVVSGTTGPFDVHFQDCTFDSNSQGANNNVGHLFVGPNATGVRIRDTYFGQSILSRTNKVTYAIENGAPFANDIRATGCRFQAGDYATGIIGGAGGTSGMVIRDSYGYNPKGVLGPPAVPATTVAYTNAYGVDATVHVTGGTVTAIATQGVTTGLTSGSFRVPSGSTITLTYSVAPTWVWIGD